MKITIKKNAFGGETIFTSTGRLAAKYGAVNLGQGFPDFPPSEKLLDIYAKKLRSGSHQYAPSSGIYPLREKIADYSRRHHHAVYNPDTEVTVTPGATNAIFAALTAFVGAGDKVIIFEPFFDSYIPGILMCGAEYCAVPLLGNNADWGVFEQHFDARVKAVIVNSPHNPSGRVLERDFFLTLADKLAGTDTVVISDEVYEYMAFDGILHTSAGAVAGLYDRSIVISSFGKCFHVTGWKVGCAKAPKPLSDALRNIFQYQTFSVNSVAQEAISEYMDDDRELLGMADFYQQKRDYLLQCLHQETLFEPEECTGTYFLVAAYPKISQLNDDVFCVDLIKKYDVALIPMSPFYVGQRAVKRVRICFAKKQETIDAAIEKLANVRSLL